MKETATALFRSSDAKKMKEELEKRYEKDVGHYKYQISRSNSA